MNKAAKVFLQAIATFAIMATALPLLPAKQWYVRVFDFPRMQILLLAVVCLLAYLFKRYWHRRRDRFLLFGLAAASIYQAINIYPYTIAAPHQVKGTEQAGSEEAQLSVLVSNVLMDNREYNGLITLIRDKRPDVLLTLESDAAWQEALRPVTKDFPYRVEIPLDNTYGMHLYSKLPLHQPRVSYLLDEDIPSIRTYVELRNGSWVELHAVHPKPPVPTEDANSKKRDAEIVLVGKAVAQSKYPVVVAGDFNDVAWSHTTYLFQEISGLLDPRIGRGLFNTFHAHYPFLRWPLDHVFHSNHFKLRNIARLPAVGSDHFPIYINLSFEPDAKYEQPAPQADEETQEEAAETIEEGREEAREN